VPVKKDEFQPALRTVREVVANYIETARMERKKSATAEADRKALETGVLPELGDIPVAELTASRIETWRNELASRGRRKTGPKPPRGHGSGRTSPLRKEGIFGAACRKEARPHG